MPIEDPGLVTREVCRDIESRAQQGPGNRRSIFFAALLSFCVPLTLTLLSGYFANDRYFLKAEIKKENSNSAILELTNDSRKSIESFILNLNYGSSKLVKHTIKKPDYSSVCISEVGRYPKVTTNSSIESDVSDDSVMDLSSIPYTCSFKIENLPPNSTIILELDFEKTNEAFSIAEVLGKNLFIISGWYGKYWINYFYMIVVVVFLVCLIFLFYYLYRYYKSSEIAKKLTYHISFVVERLAREKDLWKGQTLSGFYKIYQTLRKQSGDTPGDRADFEKFVNNNDLSLAGAYSNPDNSEIKSYICFAPFDFMGSPTYSKVFHKNKKVLFLFYSSDKTILKIGFENLKDLHIY